MENKAKYRIFNKVNKKIYELDDLVKLGVFTNTLGVIQKALKSSNFYDCERFLIQKID